MDKTVPRTRNTRRGRLFAAMGLRGDWFLRSAAEAPCQFPTQAPYAATIGFDDPRQVARRSTAGINRTSPSAPRSAAPTGAGGILKARCRCARFGAQAPFHAIQSAAIGKRQSIAAAGNTDER